MVGSVAMEVATGEEATAAERAEERVEAAMAAAMEVVVREVVKVEVVRAAVWVVA